MSQGVPAQPLTTPSADHRMPELDGLRGIALVLVLLTHCLVVPDQGVVAWVVRNTISIGWVGVDLFFALSGFLITGILLRSKPQPGYFRRFYVRRALRILPLYWIVLVLLLAGASILPFGPRGEGWPFLTFASNLWNPLYRLGLLAERGPYAPLAHTWTLAIEGQFYLLFPLVVFLLDRKRLTALLWAVIVLMPFVRLTTNALTAPGESYFLTWCRLDPLAMGALVALTLHERPSVGPALLHRARILCVGLLAATAMMWVTRQINFAKPFFNACGLTLVDGALALALFLVVVGGGGRVGSLLRLKPVVAFGGVSYGVYLIHYPLVLLAQQYLPQGIPRGTWLWTFGFAGATLGPTLVLAALSWHFFERPILQMSKALLREQGRGA